MKRRIEKSKYLKLPKDIKLKGVDAETKLFILLHAILGYSAADSYQIAFTQSKANRISATAMASKLLREPIVMENIDYLWQKSFQGFLFNDNARKNIPE